MSNNSPLMFPPSLHSFKAANRHFWDYEERDPQRGVRQLMGEERLWANVLIQAIQEYKGVSKDALKECVKCHQDAHPQCFKVHKRNGEDYVMRTDQKCRDWHTVSECANNWLFDDEEYGEGAFLWVCDSLGIDKGYLRNNLGNEAYEAYWQDETRINVFLGFQVKKDVAPCVSSFEKSHVRTGHADSGEEED